MGRRTRALRASVCQALLASPVLSRLPNEAEHERALACSDANQFLDFTESTRPFQLPPCKERCDWPRESLGKGNDPLEPGDLPSCVRRRESQNGGQNGYRVRFGLYYSCVESLCEHAGRWHFFHQMTSVKVAHMLGIPMSEVKSAFLYWVAETWPQTGVPKLKKFLIRRDDEPNVTRRLVSAADPMYVLYIAVRVDSARLNPTSPGVEVLRGNDVATVANNLGMGFQVRDFEIAPGNLTAAEAAAVPYKDFQNVFQFDGLKPNETPEAFRGGEVGGVADALREKAMSCLNPCHVVFENANDLGPHRCKDDCDCNGERWCGHMGLCVGESQRCRGNGGAGNGNTVQEPPTTTLAPVTTPQAPQPGSGGSAGSSGSSGGGSSPSRSGGGSRLQVTTTRGSSLSQLTPGCYNTVIGAWQTCSDAGTACQDLPCFVVQAAVDAVGCHQDICTSQLFLDQWLRMCSSNATRSAFFQHVQQCTATTTTPPRTTTTTTLPESIAGGLGMIFLYVALSTLGVCLTMVAVKAFMSRDKLPETRVWRGTIALARSCSSVMEKKRRVVVVPGQEDRKKVPRSAPPGTPPRMPFAPFSDHGRKSSAQSDPWNLRTPPHPTGAGNTGQSWSTAASPPFWQSATGEHTKTPPQGTSSWPSPGSAFQQAKEAWSPDSGEPSPFQQFPPSRDSWKTPWRKSSHGRKSSSKSANKDSERGKSPDSEISVDPISPRALTKELQQVRRAASKQQILQISNPKSLRKELSRQRESCTSAERRRLFKDLLLRWHPDKNAGDELRAAEMFQALQECKEWFFSDD